MKKFYFLLVATLVSFLAEGQIQQISDPLLAGGRIRDHAKNSSCVLVATEGGIFKTTDQGISWTNVSQSLDPAGIECEKIVCTGSDFYVRNNSPYNSGIFKSSNNGTDWTRLNFTNWWPQSLGCISNKLFVVGNNQVTGEGRIYSSTNGTDWTPGAVVWSGWGNNHAELYSFGQDKLYLLYNGDLLYTTDGSQLNGIATTGLGGSGFSNNDNDFFGDSAGNIYFRTDNKVFRYNFATSTWIDISTGKIPAENQILNLSVTDNAIFVSTLTPSAMIALYRSTNQGSAFSVISNPGILAPMIEGIFETSSNKLIGMGLYEQVLVSSNGGDTWAEYPNQYIALNTSNLTLSGNALHFSTENRGIIRSENGTTPWATGNAGIPGFNGIAHFVNDLFVVKDTLFSFLQPDPFTENLLLYKSIDKGISWNPCLIKSPYNTGENYAFAGKCDSALFISYYNPGTSNYSLITSFDNGANWTKRGPLSFSNRIFLRGPKHCLFAFSENSGQWSDFNNVSRANSFGISFTDINTGNLFNNNRYIKREININHEKGGPIMGYDPASNKAMFVVRDFTTGNNDKLYQYNITTSVWSEIIASGLPQDYQGNCLRNIAPNTWLLATNEGLYRSFDGGASWNITHNASGWQKGMIVNSIQLIGKKTFLGTLANGVWSIDLPSSLNDVTADGNWNVYPNPFKDKLTLEIPRETTSATASLFTTSGIEVVKYQLPAKTSTLNTAFLPAGNYILQVKTQQQIYRKLIIKR